MQHVFGILTQFCPIFFIKSPDTKPRPLGRKVCQRWNCSASTCTRRQSVSLSTKRLLVHVSRLAETWLVNQQFSLKRRKQTIEIEAYAEKIHWCYKHDIHRVQSARLELRLRRGKGNTVGWFITVPAYLINYAKRIYKQSNSMGYITVSTYF